MYFQKKKNVVYPNSRIFRILFLFLPFRRPILSLVVGVNLAYDINGNDRTGLDSARPAAGATNQRVLMWIRP